MKKEKKRQRNIRQLHIIAHEVPALGLAKLSSADVTIDILARKYLMKGHVNMRWLKGIDLYAGHPLDYEKAAVGYIFLLGKNPELADNKERKKLRQDLLDKARISYIRTIETIHHVIQSGPSYYPEVYSKTDEVQLDSNSMRIENTVLKEDSLIERYARLVEVYYSRKEHRINNSKLDKAVNKNDKNQIGYQFGLVTNFVRTSRGLCYSFDNQTEFNQFLNLISLKDTSKNATRK